jgi:Skp family chaperone for outer membrane proteins
MKTLKVILLGCALAAPALFIAGSANAQVAGVAVANPEAVILGAKALGTAFQTIGTTYKPQLDQARTRQTQLEAQIKTLSAPLDTNKDGQISQAELQAGQAARSPALTQIENAQKAAQQEMSRLTQPATLAQMYAIDQITQKYPAALKTVVDTKKISLLLSADSVIFGTPAVDVTDDIRTAVDAAAPTVPVTPPANWQPSQQDAQLLQQYFQIANAQAQRAQQAAPTPGAKPTTPAPGR